MTFAAALIRITAVLCLAAILGAQDPPPPIQVATRLPRTLDLRGVDPSRLIPLDNRNAAQTEGARAAWVALLGPFQGAEAVRLVLPEQGPRLPVLMSGILTPRGGCQACRLPLLLAASQALKATMPGCRLLLAYQAGQEAILEEAAWGALDGGVLLPGDLGPDPDTWRGLLAQAQGQMPGRPWFLWLDQDPGPLAGALLGDGARLVVAAGGPSARLARELPPGALDVEGGLGDLILTPRKGGSAHRWLFQAGGWVSAPLPVGRTEVAVDAAEPYDVGALLGRVRAAQAHNAASLRNVEGKLAVDVHGPDGDIGLRLDTFWAAGEAEELVQREVLVNGVRMNLGPEFRFPLGRDRFHQTVMPVALAPSEHYHYTDGGPAGPGRRRLKFKPLPGDLTLYEGTLLVAEDSGQILGHEVHREGQLGAIRSEDGTGEAAEVLPGVFITVRWRTLVRVAGSTWNAEQLVVTTTLKELRINEAEFAARRERVRQSDAVMFKRTVDGLWYFVKRSAPSSHP